MPHCREVTRLLSKSMDLPLSGKEKLQLRVHLLICRHCRRFSQQMQQMRGLFQHRQQQDENEN